MAIYKFEFNNTISSTDTSPTGIPIEPELHYFVEMTVYDPAIGGTKTLRYCTGRGYETGGNYYEPRVKSTANLKISLYQSGKTSGASQIGYGEVVFFNTDGGLDALLGYGFDGRAIVIKKAFVVGAVVGALTTVLSCSMEQPEATWNDITIRIRDNQDRLNVPLQPVKYAGTNTLPNGVEGADDIKGKPKPLLFGSVKNATPVCVNTSRLIYQVHSGVLYSVDAVYDKGVRLKAGVPYSTQADMEATEPAPGEFRSWLAGGMFRLGSSPVGQVTADAIEGTATERTAAKIFVRVADQSPTIASSDVDAADVTTLHAASGATIGLYSSQESTVAAALDEVMQNIGGWYTFDTTGKIRIGRLDAPTGSPVLTITDSEKLNIERIPSNDEGRGVPVWRVNLGYDRNFTVQTDLAGSLLTAYWVLAGGPGWGTDPVFGNGLWVITAANSTIVWTSPDAITWTQRGINITTNANPRLSYANRLWTIHNSGTVYATSTDTITWTTRTMPASGLWQKVVHGNGTYFNYIKNTTTGATSADGINWTTTTLPFTASMVDVEFACGLFVALIPNTNTAYTSPDGLNWTARTLPATGDWRGPKFGAGLFVGVGRSSNQCVTSSDGITWTLRTLPSNSTWADVEFGDDLFIAITDTLTEGMSLSAYSKDGINWTQQTMTNLGIQWNRIGYGNGLFLTRADGVEYSGNYSHRLPPARQTWLAKEYRTITVEDANVKTKHLLARELNVTTSIIGVNSALAQTEATRLLNLYKVDRDRLRITVPACIVPADILGKVISVKVPRYGYDAGRLMQVIGQEIDHSTNRVVLDVWG